VKTARTGDATQRRRDRLIQEAVHDPYKATTKPREPSACRECGVVFSDGRWHWSPDLPTGAAEALCPACQRLRDRVPAGFLTLGGGFFRQHRDDIMHLVRNTVDAQQKEHPMKRLMNIEDADEGVVVTFTDIHLPHTVGKAIEQAYDGELEIRFGDESGIARAYWSRQD
jgi:NMD protein affecting ribosome stability and mRNA decay